MCELTLSAYKKGCKTPSGIKSVYIVDHDSRVASAVVYSIASGALTISGTSSMNAYHLTPVDNSINLTTPLSSSIENNSYKFDRVVELKFDNYSSSLATLVDNIIKGRTELLVEWVNGIYTYVGNERGLNVTGGDGGASGSALDDAKGITLTLTEEATAAMPTATFSEFDAAFTIVEPS